MHPTTHNRLTQATERTYACSYQQKVVDTIASCKTPTHIDGAIELLENYMQRHTAEVLFLQRCQNMILNKLVEISYSYE